MNKKATLDNMWVMISFFAFAVILLVTQVFWNNVTTSAMDDDFWSRSSIGPNMKANAQRAIDNYDNLGLLAYIAIHLGVIILSFMLRNHPIFFVVVFFMSIIIVIVAVPLSNTWETNIITENELDTAIISYPKVNYLITNLPKFELIWTLITAVSMFGFSRMDQGGYP